MFFLTLADDPTHVHSDLQLIKLHALLCPLLTAKGYDRLPTISDMYQMSAPSGYRSKRLEEWRKVFTISKQAHTKVVSFVVV